MFHLLLPTFLYLGKTKILRLLQSKDVNEWVDCFGNLSSTQNEIGQNGFKVAIKR